MNRLAKVARRVGSVGLALIAGCVPQGSAPPYDAGPSPAISSTFKASIGIMTAPFEDTFDRPDASEMVAPVEDASAEPVAAGDAATDAGADAQVTTRPSAEAGRPSNLGPNWTTSLPGAWRVENGRLCGEGAHNHGVWLNRTLPVNARIEFDAYALSEEGDLKAELWGDGQSFAKGNSYTNATSYLAILGGWKNSFHVLARLNEHGTDRKEIHVDKTSDDPRQQPAVRGQLYQFKIERSDGKTVRWSVNGTEYLVWNDPAPLTGQGHDHFGFNEWEVKVCFDNVKVTPL